MSRYSFRLRVAISLIHDWASVCGINEGESSGGDNLQALRAMSIKGNLSEFEVFLEMLWIDSFLTKLQLMSRMALINFHFR